MVGIVWIEKPRLDADYAFFYPKQNLFSSIRMLEATDFKQEFFVLVKELESRYAFWLVITNNYFSDNSIWRID